MKEYPNLITWIVPVRTICETNTSEHWSSRAKRRKQQALILWYSYKREKQEIKLPCHITMTRLSPHLLDVDSISSSMKALTDELADILVPEKGGWYVTKAGQKKRKKGHSDSDSRLSWSYGQEKNKSYAVKVEIRF